MKWVTREPPKIDRIACTWLIARFIDRTPEFLYVPANQVLKIAAETGAYRTYMAGASRARPPRSAQVRVHRICMLRIISNTPTASSANSTKPQR